MYRALHLVYVFHIIGWKPRRTIIFALWDASKYGHIGAYEWAQVSGCVLHWPCCWRSPFELCFVFAFFNYRFTCKSICMLCKSKHNYYFRVFFHTDTYIINSLY